ncbi:GldL-related protein [Flavobacterium piscinae]|uniref:GldL-related protein n=1 Tax=Flavobacterium piscinae TaxID=2506424 RepID=UPI00268B2580
MFKKFFYIIISFLVGIVLVILGSLFKIMHYSNANLFLISGMFFELLALLLLIVKIVKQSQKEKV